MEDSSLQTFATHPVDVLGFLADALDRAEHCALVTIIALSGGGIRARGALMGVTETGRAAGYISNGCVDADVIHQTQEVLRDGTPRQLRYGEGSPFVDVRLPCGGSLDLLIVPVSEHHLLAELRAQSASRQPSAVTISMNGLSRASYPAGKTEWDGSSLTIPLLPRPRLRIAGRGAEPVALARLGAALDMEVYFQSPDESCLAEARTCGAVCEKLSYSDAMFHGDDDPWTALILMFHDHDWETELLKAALLGPAFYIGALGSRRTHERRCCVLREAGISDEQIARIHAPIGLIPAARDAGLLSISTLAEVAAAWQKFTS